MQAKTIVYAYVRTEYAQRHEKQQYTQRHEIHHIYLFIYLFIYLTDSCADNLWAC